MDISILLCSCLGPGHSKNIKKVLGIGVNTTPFVIRKGFSFYYYDNAELESFGKELARRVIQNHALSFQWCKKVKEGTDCLRSLMKKYYGKLISKEAFENFIKHLDEYVVVYVAVKQVANYLPKDVLPIFLPVFDENRNYSESIFPEMIDFFDSLAKTISEKTGYNSHLILSCVKSEFEHYLLTGKLPDKAILEKRFEAAVLDYYKGDYKLYSGEHVGIFEEALLGSSDVNYLQGMAAHPGKVIGKVSVVLNPHDAAHFKKGDILIAGMTRPAYLHLMEKASAIVTDAGGILCHAAIVAREMKIPTIVGTEKATVIFRNGDLVEVDAYNGIVKKIKKN